MKKRKTDIQVCYEDISGEYDSTTIYATYKELKYLVSLIRNIKDNEEIVLNPSIDIDDFSCALIIKNDNSIDEIDSDEVDVNIIVEEPYSEKNNLTIIGGKEGLNLFCDIIELSYPYMKGFKRSDLLITITFSNGIVSFNEPVTNTKYASLNYIFEDRSEDYMWFKE